VSFEPQKSAAQSVGEKPACFWVNHETNAALIVRGNVEISEQYQTDAEQYK